MKKVAVTAPSCISKHENIFFVYVLRECFKPILVRKKSALDIAEF